MSERRQAQGAVHDAWLEAAEFRAKLIEARDRIEMYDFLKDANPELLRFLKATTDAVRDIEMELYAAQVATETAQPNRTPGDESAS